MSALTIQIAELAVVASPLIGIPEIAYTMLISTDNIKIGIQKSLNDLLFELGVRNGTDLASFCFSRH